jgi:hypothetical protein
MTERRIVRKSSLHHDADLLQPLHTLLLHRPSLAYSRVAISSMPAVLLQLVQYSDLLPKPTAAWCLVDSCPQSRCQVAALMARVPDRTHGEGCTSHVLAGLRVWQIASCLATLAGVLVHACWIHACWSAGACMQKGQGHRATHKAEMERQRAQALQQIEEDRLSRRELLQRTHAAPNADTAVGDGLPPSPCAGPTPASQPLPVPQASECSAFPGPEGMRRRVLGPGPHRDEC